jgi:hypothetical protein
MHARLGTGQWTIKGLHTAGDQMIMPSVFASRFAVVAVRYKIAYCSAEEVKLSQNKLK